jgi:DNA/RNA endonuclease YhcR with UshA esterase domain
MEENYLLALIVSFLFGFVLFRKDKTDPEESKEIKHTLSARDSSISSVEKYLNKHNISANSKDRLSGVSKYLQEKDSLNIELEKSVAVSSVEKYLATKEKDSPVSSVSKYMAKKTIHEKKRAKENLSGVEKYLKKND